jgi:hypothetical protein
LAVVTRCDGGAGGGASLASRSHAALCARWGRRRDKRARGSDRPGRPAGPKRRLRGHQPDVPLSHVVGVHSDGATEAAARRTGDARQRQRRQRRAGHGEGPLRGGNISKRGSGRTARHIHHSGKVTSRYCFTDNRNQCYIQRKMVTAASFLVLFTYMYCEYFAYFILFCSILCARNPKNLQMYFPLYVNISFKKLIAIRFIEIDCKSSTDITTSKNESTKCN